MLEQQNIVQSDNIISKLSRTSFNSFLYWPETWVSKIPEDYSLSFMVAFTVNCPTSDQNYQQIPDIELGLIMSL